MSWQDYVRRVTPYTPGEQPQIADVIKLNTNENPYPPSPRVREVLSGLDPALLRRYPDPAAARLAGAIARRYGLPQDQVFVGVGSDDVLAMSFLTFFGSDKPILFADITYSFYDVWADVFRIPYETVALDEHFRIRPEDYRRECGGIVIANPNAPTGEDLPPEQIRQVLEEHPDVAVIVDEAYVDFGAQSVLDLIGEYPNLLVVQTFSKSRSLAGLRIGCAAGSKEMIRCLSDVKYSFNSYTMNLPSIEAGAAAIEDEAYFQETRERIMKTREQSRSRLEKMGFRATDSKTNFLFVTHERVPARHLFEALKERHIYVRYFDKPRIDNYLRITVGTDEEMEKLAAALQEIIREYRE